jgi:hypothetical protein
MAGWALQFNNRRRKPGRLSNNTAPILRCRGHGAHLGSIDGMQALGDTVPQICRRITRMTYGKTLTLTLAAGAMALAGFTAAPARADDQQLLGILAGAAALAIIANAGNDNGGRGYRGGNRWDGGGDRWHHHRHHRWDNDGYGNDGYGNSYGYGYGNSYGNDDGGEGWGGDRYGYGNGGGRGYDR